MSLPSDFRGKTLAPKLIWVDGQLRSNWKITVSSSGEVLEIGEHVASKEVIDLPDAIILPGFVNAHSHAFHRYLRGKSGIGTPGADTFWKWREAMYDMLENTDFEQFKNMCKGTFDEMLKAGITTVGEFHYVHHGQEKFELDRAVIKAAAESGIRLVLIETLYMRSGFTAETVTEKQERFKCDFYELTKNIELLKKDLPGTTSIAVAAHSTRAVTVESIQWLWDYSQQNDVAFHVHLEEQPKEVEDCFNSFHNMRPCELLLDKLPGSRQNLTAVHCTYTPREKLNDLVNTGASVCVCPLTEGFLGDGIPAINELDNLCIGTDCNNRISVLEELRWLTYCQNMKNNKRNCANLDAAKLLRVATANGAKSLKLKNKVGEFVQGSEFDFVIFDATATRLREFTEPSVALDSIIFGCGNEEIAASGVAGQVLYTK